MEHARSAVLVAIEFEEDDLVVVGDERIFEAMANHVVYHLACERLVFGQQLLHNLLTQNGSELVESAMYRRFDHFSKVDHAAEFQLTYEPSPVLLVTSFFWQTENDIRLLSLDAICLLDDPRVAKCQLIW